MVVDSDEAPLNVRLADNKDSESPGWQYRGRGLKPVDKAQMPRIQMTVILCVIKRDHRKRQTYVATAPHAELYSKVFRQRWREYVVDTLARTNLVLGVDAKEARCNCAAVGRS